MKILAIDQAGSCGWKSPNASGVWNLKTKADESAGMKLLRFRSKLKEICELESIDIIIYERAASQYKNAIISGAKFIAIIELFCVENNLEYKAYSAKEIKTFATGKGNANKEQMIQAAKDKYGYEGESDDEADAIHIYHLAKQDLGL